MQATTVAIIENAIKGDMSLDDYQRKALLDALLEERTSLKQMITAQEAADILGCTKSYILTLGKTGKIRRIVYSPKIIKYYAEDVKKFKYSGHIMH
jgi:hypothetical protein